MPTNEERYEVVEKFRKRPVVVDAYQTKEELDIETLEGTMHASVGDWIITGVNGEKYPCKPDIFKKTYEPLRSCSEDTPNVDRLADLIDPEPTVDRDALLDIARQMEWASEASYEEVGVVSGGIVGAWAEKIKEACSEVNNHEA